MPIFKLKNKISTKIAAKILISIGILSALFLHMDFGSLKQASREIHFSAWFYSISFIALQIFLLSLRWMYLINIKKHRMNYSESLQVTVASMVANILFITTIGGIIVRVAMACQHGVPMIKAIFATAVDRIATLAALLLLSIIFLPSLGSYVEAPLAREFSIYIAALMLVLFIMAPAIVLAMIHYRPKGKPLSKSVETGLGYIKILFSDPKLLGKILVTSLLAQLSFFISVFCIVIAAETNLSFLQIMTVLPIISLIASIPISFGGWGVRESAFIFGLGLLGVPMELAFTISVQIGILGLIATAIAGLPILAFSDLVSMTIKSSFKKTA